MLTPDMKAVIEAVHLYWRVTDEAELRATWRERRKELDREFEAHIALVGPVRVEERERSPQPGLRA